MKTMAEKLVDEFYKNDTREHRDLVMKKIERSRCDFDYHGGVEYTYYFDDDSVVYVNEFEVVADMI